MSAFKHPCGVLVRFYVGNSHGFAGTHEEEYDLTKGVDLQTWRANATAYASQVVRTFTQSFDTQAELDEHVALCAQAIVDSRKEKLLLRQAGGYRKGDD